MAQRYRFAGCHDSTSYITNCVSADLPKRFLSESLANQHQKVRQTIYADDLVQLSVVNNHIVSIWVLGDQLLKNHPAITAAEEAHGRDPIRIIMVESQRRARRLVYHRKKLVLVFSAMRHYALRLQMEGYIVDYQQAETFLEGLKAHAHAHRSSHIYTMAASTYGGRRFQEVKLADDLGLPVSILPNIQFLSDQYNPYPNPIPGKRYVMEHFYRAMRRHFGFLIDEALFQLVANGTSTS